MGKEHGTVAAGDEKTARVGADILRAGGNAVDAAVAANLAAFVAEPVLTGPYGGGFACVAGNGESRYYDMFSDSPGQSLGPSDTQPDLDFVGVDVDFGAATQTFHCGRGAVAASSFLPGLVQMQQERGRLPLADIVAPAVTMARDGVEISLGIASFITVLEPILRLTEESSKLFAPGGRLLRSGDIFSSPDLADRLEELGAETIHGISRSQLLRSFGPPVGRLTAEDLSGCRAIQREPVHAAVGRHEVLLNPPPSSGGTLVAFSLRLLEGVSPSVWRDDVACALHMTAAMAVTNAARAHGLDPGLQAGQTEVGERFLSDTYLDGWREPFERAARDGPKEHDFKTMDLGGTTHISVIDAQGLACGITSSNGEGCGHVIPGVGVMANNFMGEDDLHPHGFFKVVPGQRLTSMMCPTVVTIEGIPELVLGTGGSNRIRTALFQVLVNHLLRDMPIEAAVRAPRLHYEGNCLFFEHVGPGSEMPREVVNALAGHVHETVMFEAPNMFFGGVHAVDGNGHGAGDPRRGGAVCAAT